MVSNVSLSIGEFVNCFSIVLVSIVLCFKSGRFFVIHAINIKLISFSIQITDLNGKQIYSGTIEKDQPLNISNYTQRIYLVTISNKEANKKNTYKIIKK